MTFRFVTTARSYCQNWDLKRRRCNPYRNVVVGRNDMGGSDNLHGVSIVTGVLSLAKRHLCGTATASGPGGSSSSSRRELVRLRRGSVGLAAS